jgi:hypothetical protein
MDRDAANDRAPGDRGADGAALATALIRSAEGTILSRRSARPLTVAFGAAPPNVFRMNP